MSKGQLTVIVARFAETTSRKYTISQQVILSLGIFVCLFLAAFVVTSLHYYHMLKKTAEYSRLKVEADELRMENEKFRVVAKQLTEKVGALEMASKKLKIFTGLDREGLGGAGGPFMLDAPAFNLSSKDIIQHFKTLDTRAVNLETDLQRLNDLHSRRTMLLSATPAVLPVRGYTSDGFGWRRDPFNGRRDFHTGIDISAPHGQKVIATADGFVTFSGRRFAYGNVVTLEHRFGVSTRYAHLVRFAVRAGQWVKKGDTIGYVGATGRATGPHLHYEVRINGQPVNPLAFIREQSD